MTVEFWLSLQQQYEVQAARAAGIEARIAEIVPREAEPAPELSVV